MDNDIIRDPDFSGKVMDGKIIVLKKIIKAHCANFCSLVTIYSAIEIFCRSGRIPKDIW